MAVARTYEKMEIIGQPYSYDNAPKKMYVKVKGPCKRCGGSGQYSFNPKDGTMCLQCRGSGFEVKEVRWYTESQRAAMDRAAAKKEEAKAQKEKTEINGRPVYHFFPARNAFGFGEQGFITLLRGEYNEIQEWRDILPVHTVLYNTIFGWYIPSEKTPEQIPDNFTTYKLNWNEVHTGNEAEYDMTMQDNDTVKAYVDNIFYVPSKSEYQGVPGEWLERGVTIKQNIAMEGYAGKVSHMHIMEDENENIYIWTTTSKNIEIGTQLYMRMKVKEHKEYKGTKQTVVYYCKEK